jgi:hypothetical protein
MSIRVLKKRDIKAAISSRQSLDKIPYLLAKLVSIQLFKPGHKSV